MLSAIKLLLLSQITLSEYEVRAGGLATEARFVPSTEEILLSNDEVKETSAAAKEQDKSEDKNGDDEGSSSDDDSASSGSDSDGDKSDDEDSKEKPEKLSQKAEPVKTQEAAQEAPKADKYGRDAKGEYLHPGTYAKDRDALNADEKVHEDMFFNIQDKLNDPEYVSTVAARPRAQDAVAVQTSAEITKKDNRVFIWGGDDSDTDDSNANGGAGGSSDADQTSSGGATEPEAGGSRTPPPAKKNTKRKDGEAPETLSTS